jgi:hypothetical protein
MSRIFMTVLAIVLAAIAESAQTPVQPHAPAQPQNTSKCSLTAAQAPAIRGIKLGMSAEEIVSIFPGSSQRPEIKTALESSEGYPNYGVATLYFQLSTYPTVAKDRFAGIDGISVTLFDGRVAELWVNYAGQDSRPRGPLWPNVDEFIAKLSEAYALPAARDWRQVAQDDKVLECSGLNIEATAANGRASVSLRATKSFDTSRERAAEDEEKIRREFKP